MNLPVVHSPDYDARFPADHRFPMGKYTHLIDILRSDGLIEGSGYHRPEPAAAEILCLAHDRAYVEHVVAATVPQPIEKIIGFPVCERVALRARAATAGTILAARLALEEGVACNTAGGSHHARHAHGAGFCTFNDVAVAAKLLLNEGTISRALVIDLDVHQGDGTAEIFEDEPRVFTVSVHAERNYPNEKAASDMDIALPDGVRDDAYIEIVEDTLICAMLGGRPDIVFYNAGVDPHHADRLGRLCLTDEGLRRREKLVIGFFRERGIPLCGVIGGGYGRDAAAVAARHAILFHAARDFV